MTGGNRGFSQLARRASVALCLCAAGGYAGVINGWAVVLLVAWGLALYGLWPAVPRPAGAMAMHRGSAVIGPDLIGFGLLTFLSRFRSGSAVPKEPGGCMALP
jgi:hypothetical protein